MLRSGGGNMVKRCTQNTRLIKMVNARRPIAGHKKTPYTDQFHIQRHQAHCEIRKIPLYKKRNRRYNRKRNVLIIQLLMEGLLRRQGAGVCTTCSCIAIVFMPCKQIITLLFQYCNRDFVFSRFYSNHVYRCHNSLKNVFEPLFTR